MDIKKLMVGDWVYIWNYPSCGLRVCDLYPAKIVSVIQGFPDEDVNIIECVIPQRNGYGVFSRPINDWKGIPLTEEFFEKNGFKFLMEDEKYKTLCLNEPYINCTFVKEFKDWMITAGAAGSVKKRFVEVSKVQFVHQFQQLLRLCGYEMDVVV